MPTVTLTSAFCDAAKGEPGRQVEYGDTKCVGLALRISAQGRKVWSYRYRTNAGKQCRLTLGVFSPALGLAEARVKANRLRAAVDEGKDPAADKRLDKIKERARSIRTFDDLAQAYFTACETGQWTPRGKVKRARSLADETGVYRRHLKSHLGGLALEEISRAVVKRRLRAMAAKGIGAQTNKAHQVVRGVFAYGLAEELVPETIAANPAAGLPAMAEIKARARTLTAVEILRLWCSLADDDETIRSANGKVFVGPHMRIALQLCLLLLTRKGEIIGMRRSELDLDQRLWLIPAERMKGNRPHLVPLPPSAVSLIEAAIELNDGEVDFVFPSPRDPTSKAMRPDSVSHAMAAVTAALGIEDASPHDLRRTGATALTSERLGFSPFIRSQVLGHMSDTGGGAAVSSSHYDTNTYLVEKRRALEAWAALVEEIVSGRRRPSNVRQMTA